MQKQTLAISLAVVFVAVALLVALGVTATGSVIYGKCWPVTDIEENTASQLRQSGCIVEDTYCQANPAYCTKNDAVARVCCPTSTCPENEGVAC
jgi:hypothetical protein